MNDPLDHVDTIIWRRGVCAFCDAAVQPGEPLTWLQLHDLRQTGLSLTVHVACLKRVTNDSAWAQIEHRGLVTFTDGGDSGR